MCYDNSLCAIMGVGDEPRATRTFSINFTAGGAPNLCDSSNYPDADADAQLSGSARAEENCAVAVAEGAATTNQDAVLNDPRPEANEVTIQSTEP